MLEIMSIYLWIGQEERMAQIEFGSLIHVGAGDSVNEGVKEQAASETFSQKRFEGLVYGSVGAAGINEKQQFLAVFHAQFYENSGAAVQGGNKRIFDGCDGMDDDFRAAGEQKQHAYK